MKGNIDDDVMNIRLILALPLHPRLADDCLLVRMVLRALVIYNLLELREFLNINNNAAVKSSS